MQGNHVDGPDLLKVSLSSRGSGPTPREAFTNSVYNPLWLVEGSFFSLPRAASAPPPFRSSCMFLVSPPARLRSVPPLGPVRLRLVDELLQVAELNELLYLIFQGTALLRWMVAIVVISTTLWVISLLTANRSNLFNCDLWMNSFKWPSLMSYSILSFEALHSFIKWSWLWWYRQRFEWSALGGVLALLGLAKMLTTKAWSKMLDLLAVRRLYWGNCDCRDDRFIFLLSQTLL